MDNKWDLFEKNDYKKINAMLDKHFSELINSAKVKISDGADPILEGHNVRRAMESFMDSIEGYGASDTEPRTLLLNLICEELNLPLNKNTIDKI